MTNVKFDYKKEYKDLYMPKVKPCIIDVPAMHFIMVEGSGNPNSSDGEYKQAMELLYGLSYTIKMSKMGEKHIKGYFEYVVPPLEGLWWMNDNSPIDYCHKEKFCWISMIRQPEFVTKQVFEWACSELKKKKTDINVSKARFAEFAEGLCVQMMHIGPFDNEPETIEKIEEFIKENDYKNAICDVLPCGMVRRHHEIYLSDPRKGDPLKFKTVIRHPIK